jgi:Fe-S cluster assembly iron-binding protein IscA
MSDAELEYLRERVELGDEDAAARLVELAGERADSHELRLLAESGGTAELSEPVQLAAEQGDVDEVQRLASAGDPDGAAVLDALYADDPGDDGT